MILMLVQTTFMAIGLILRLMTGTSNPSSGNSSSNGWTINHLHQRLTMSKSPVGLLILLFENPTLLARNLNTVVVNGLNKHPIILG